MGQAEKWCWMDQFGLWEENISRRIRSIKACIALVDLFFYWYKPIPNENTMIMTIKSLILIHNSFITNQNDKNINLTNIRYGSIIGLKGKQNGL